MGTKVQCKGYLSEFCTMRDLNEDADSSWSPYYANGAPGRNLVVHGQRTGRSSRYSGYDKESIKRTMLEHDAIFRNQLYELHRLYNRQRELMSELQKKGPYKYLQAADTSQSNSFPSQIQSDGTNRIWHVPPLPVTSTSYNKVPVTAIDDKIPPLNFLKESSAQSGPIFIGKRASLEVADITDSNDKIRSRRMFDLQLPADVYVDCEDAEKSEKEILAESSTVTTIPIKNTQAHPGTDVKFTLGTSEDRNCREDSWKSGLCTHNGLVARSLADLNEPLKENKFERTAGSVSYNFFSQITSLEDSQGHQFPTRLNTGFAGLQSVLCGSKNNEEGTYPNLLQKAVGQERPFFNYETGKTTSNMALFGPGYAKENLSTSSEATQLKLKKPLEILSPNQNNLWFKQTHARGIEISGICPPREQSSPSMLNSFPVLSSRDYTSTASPLLATWTNPTNNSSHFPLPVQPLPCFNGAVAQDHNSPSQWKHNGDLNSHLILAANRSSYRNGFNDGDLKLDYSSASQLNHPTTTFSKKYFDRNSDNKAESHVPQMISQVNLNQFLLNGVQDQRTSQNNSVVGGSKGKCDSSSRVPSWLRGKPAGIPSSHMDLVYSQGYPQLKHSCSAIYPGPQKKQESEKNLSLFHVQDLPSTSQVPESRITKNKASDGPSSTKLFGFPIFDNTKQTTPSSAAHQEQPMTSSTKRLEKDENEALNLENQIPLGGLVTKSSSISFRNHINLNSKPNPWETLEEGERAAIVASGINLEAPLTEQTGKSDEALVKEAAGNIIWMLTDKCTRLDDISFPISPRVPFDTLHWFADVVLSIGLDQFEQMTLELEETKSEDYRSIPWEEEDEKDDNDGKSTFASLLSTKTRRGQGRKRRQRRDFQKDILPGLASLSRQEVTADIQTIGGLMKASDKTWKAGGLKKRNMGRNGTNSPARGGRRPRSLVVAVAGTDVCPPQPPEPVEARPTNDTEAEVDGRNIVGWGRTTRRCRRQRCPPVTNVAASIT